MIRGDSALGRLEETLSLWNLVDLDTIYNIGGTIMGRRARMRRRARVAAAREAAQAPAQAPAPKPVAENKAAVKKVESKDAAPKKTTTVKKVIRKKDD